MEYLKLNVLRLSSWIKAVLVEHWNREENSKVELMLVLFLFGIAFSCHLRHLRLFFLRGLDMWIIKDCVDASVGFLFFCFLNFF
jgi:hypothetical protein